MLVTTTSKSENLKRKHDDESNESRSKIIKFDKIESFEYKTYEFVENFFKDLENFGNGKMDENPIFEVEPIKNQYRKQIEYLEQALKEAETKCDNYAKELRQMHDDAETLKIKHATEIRELQMKQQDDAKFRLEQIEKQKIQEAALQLEEQKLKNLQTEMNELNRRYSELVKEHNDSILKYNAEILEQKDLVVKQQQAAENEMHRLKSNYESQLTDLKMDWQRKYTDLEASHAKNAEKLQEEATTNGARIDSRIEELQKKQAYDIEQWTQCYAELKKDYENLSEKYNKDIMRQNSTMVRHEQDAQNAIKGYQNLLNTWKIQYSELKVEYEKIERKLQEKSLAHTRVETKYREQIDSLQHQFMHSKNECMNNWTATSDRSNGIIVDLQSERNECTNKLKTANQASTPPPQTILKNGRKRDCSKCGCPTRKFTTFAYCKSKCKLDYL